MLLVVASVLGMVAVPAWAVSTSTTARIYSDFTASPAYKNYSEFAKLYVPEASVPVPGLAHTDVNGKDCTTMVAQGLCIAKDYFIISAYDSDGKFNSILHILSNDDTGNRQYLATVTLPITGQVGGVAYDGTYLWVPNGKNVSSIKYSTLATMVNYAVKNNKKNVSVSFYSTCATETTASFVTYDDGMLWVGEYKNKGDSTGRMYSYVISSDGRSLTKKYYVTLPDRIQSACFKDGHLFLSRSYNRSIAGTDHISELRIYKLSQPGSDGSIAKNSVVKVVDLPPMVKGIAAGATYFYSLYESAAAVYYQGTDGNGKCKYPVDRVVAFALSDLLAASGSANSGTTGAVYFPFCGSDESTIENALNSKGFDFSLESRKKIAEANGISSYIGSAQQNSSLLALMKAGKLINPGLIPASNTSAKVTLNATSAVLNVGQSMTLAASFTEGSVSWKSSNKNVLTVHSLDDGAAMLVPVGEGKATVTCTLSNGTIAKCVITVKCQYFDACSSSAASIEDALAAQDFDSSLKNLITIAEANGIEDYAATTAQNTQLLTLMKAGKLINPGLTAGVITPAGSASSGKYFPKCASSYESISPALKSINVDGSFTYRTFIAIANGIENYTGTVSQNDQMLSLLKAGKLLKPVLQLGEGEYLLLFNANGGDGAMVEAVVKQGDTIPANLFVRKGYTFAGWATSATGSVAYNNKATVDFSVSTTLYAVWNPNHYTVIYDANGGTGTMGETIVSYGTNTTLATPGFTKEGYTLIGWNRYRTSDDKWFYESSDGTTTGWYVEGTQPSGYTKNVLSTTSGVSKTSSIDGDTIVMYAVWQAGEGGTSGDSSGGSSGGTSGGISLSGKKILFIGNSFVYYGGAVEHGSQKKADKGWFYQICKYNGDNVTVIDATYGSHHLYDYTSSGCKSGSCHNGKDLLSGLDLKSFDYVFISESGNNNSNFVKDVKNVKKRFPSSTKFFYLSHSYTYIKNHTKIINKLSEIKSLGIGIIEWGKLVDEVIDGKSKVSGATVSYNKKTFIKNKGDTYHPNPLAGYITAQMAYCALTGKTAVGQLPDVYDIGNTLKYGKSAVGYSAYISKHYSSSSSSNFKQVLKSQADMKGLQKLMDKYLAKRGLGCDG